MYAGLKNAVITCLLYSFSNSSYFLVSKFKHVFYLFIFLTAMPNSFECCFDVFVLHFVFLCLRFSRCAH